jgi:HK97 gp10 family phage protein
VADVDITIVTEIEGLDELEEAFTTGSKRMVKKFLSRVERRAAKVLKDSASETAPFYHGDLADDIHIQIIQGDGTLTARVGPSKNTFYGLFDEFGTAHQGAQHWLEQSARDVQDEVLDEYNEGVREGLEDMKR